MNFISKNNLFIFLFGFLNGSVFVTPLLPSLTTEQEQAVLAQLQKEAYKEAARIDAEKQLEKEKEDQKRYLRHKRIFIFLLICGGVVGGKYLYDTKKAELKELYKQTMTDATNKTNTAQEVCKEKVNLYQDVFQHKFDDAQAVCKKKLHETAEAFEKRANEEFDKHFSAQAMGRYIKAGVSRWWNGKAPEDEKKKSWYSFNS